MNADSGPNPEAEEKMDTVIKQEPADVDDSNSSAEAKIDAKKKIEMGIKIIPKEEGIAFLTIGDEVVNEENKDTLTMTKEEVRAYIEKSVFDIIVNQNPLQVIAKQAKDLQDRLKKKTDDFRELATLVNVLERDQMKMLRKDDILKKYLTKPQIVGVDMPLLKILLNKPPKPAPADSQKSIECIDLTEETAAATTTEAAPKNPYAYLGLVKHPAPLPPKPFVVPNKNLPPIPPKPRLKIASEKQGIVLTWDMAPNLENKLYAPLASFDIFGYQEQKNVAINTLLWKKIGGVKAMTLPMAVTLTQFIEGNKYHFSIRAVDMFDRCGFFSEPISITYTAK